MKRKSNPLTDLKYSTPWSITFDRDKHFQIPYNQLDSFFSTDTVAEFYTLFALHLVFYDRHRYSKQLLNYLKIVEIGDITGKEFRKNTKVKQTAHLALSHLEEKGLINYFYIPWSIAKDIDCLQSFTSIYEKQKKEIEESENHKAAIVWEFNDPPIIPIGSRLDLVEIPRDLCIKVREIARSEGQMTRTIIKLLKLALYSKAYQLTPSKITPELINPIIGFDPIRSKQKEDYNQQLVKDIYKLLVKHKVI
jgi:hypothetical protein